MSRADFKVTSDGHVVYTNRPAHTALVEWWKRAAAIIHFQHGEVDRVKLQRARAAKLIDEIRRSRGEIRLLIAITGHMPHGNNLVYRHIENLHEARRIHRDLLRQRRGA